MGMLRLDALRKAELVREPFEYLIVPQFIDSVQLESVQRDFPRMDDGGSFPLSTLTYGPAFARLAEELMGDELREIFSALFEMSFQDRPATLTVRGRTRLKDGKIHTDSKTKLLTVLVYLNRNWMADGGRLRLLRSATDLEDVVAEVPPEEGAMVAFRCRPNAWHGHHPFDGPRRSLQLNYVVDAGARRWSSFRHTMSAMLKSLRN